ncbi:DUF680 domain-containing protein [Mesorhizobium sp. AR10]|uniref:DUF680 domain-containing protein n=1 Tax=Mesorhizobium sp. AR10 TaxID=2865839 RepID=UPI00215E9441|nr:DUF680 domain-containing protein [Mesorhizobium sp. AR10]UVK37849.1 DUF680 domain-containing protein [Mesorhizobium sp. AR10]
MKKIILTTAAFLFASGMAFAGSDHYGSGFVPGADAYPSTGNHSMSSDSGYTVDLGSTASIGTAESATGGHSIPAPGYGQGIWGR